MRQDFKRVGERHQTSPANKQKRRGRLDELQDLLAQQLKEAERMQLEFNEQKEERQQEHAKQLAQHATLQEELQEQEKHSEFVAKELEQQKSSWQQRNEEQLQELRELQSKMNSLKDENYEAMIFTSSFHVFSSGFTVSRCPGARRGVMHSGGLEV